MYAFILKGASRKSFSGQHVSSAVRVCVFTLAGTVSSHSAMNSWRRTARGDWKSGLNTVFSRADPRTAPGLSRSRATAAGTAADAAPLPDAADRPRLRAIDLARKVQQEKTKPPAEEPPVSGQQRRVAELKRFSLQLQNVHPNVLAKHLDRGVLYRDEDVVVINKPYGVPVRGTLIYTLFIYTFNSEYGIIVCWKGREGMWTGKVVDK